MSADIQIQPLADRFRYNVRELLSARGSRIRLADRLGCSPQHITNTLRSDGAIATTTIELWAEALEVDPVELLKISS